MKKILLVLVALMGFYGVRAQKLVIGEKAPEVKVSLWIWERPADDKARLVEFFHSSSQQSKGRISDLSSVAARYKGKLNVILIAREPASNVTAVTGTKGGTYFAAIDDDGKTFENFGVKFVPFCVLIDKRGRVLWFGNPSSLGEDEIGRLIDQ